MLRVVTSDNAEIAAMLESTRLARLGLEHTSAGHYVALEEVIRTKHPDLAILDGDIRGGSGLQLCRAIRDDPALNEVRVMLVLPSVLERSDIEALSASGCDDVLAVPLDEDDFFHHIVSLTGKRHRRNERVAVEVELALRTDSRQMPAVAVNMSLGGLGVRLDNPVERGETVHVRIEHAGRELPEARAQVVWQREVGGDHLAGLAFAEVPVDTRLVIEELCLFEIVESPLGGVRVYIHGDIIETTNLAPLAKRLTEANPIELNLRQVSRMSSVGIRNWCQLVETLSGKRYWFRHASLAFVNQASIVPRVLGSGEILSFEAPYHCEHCERDDVRLLAPSAIARSGEELVPPSLRCPDCGGELIFDELPWRYFAFLEQP